MSLVVYTRLIILSKGKWEALHFCFWSFTLILWGYVLGRKEGLPKQISFKDNVYLCFAVWCLIHGASVSVSDIAVRCAEEALLPCEVLRDTSITYERVSWYKVRKKHKYISIRVVCFAFLPDAGLSHIKRVIL